MSRRKRYDGYMPADVHEWRASLPALARQAYEDVSKSYRVLAQSAHIRLRGSAQTCRSCR